MLVACGCGWEPFNETPRTGELTFHNDSDQTVILVHGQTLEHAAKAGNAARNGPFPPGQERMVRFTVPVPQPADDEPWCVVGDYWILGNRTGGLADLSFGYDEALDLEELAVLEYLGPDFCWPQRVVDYHFTGD